MRTQKQLHAGGVLFFVAPVFGQNAIACTSRGLAPAFLFVLRPTSPRQLKPHLSLPRSFFVVLLVAPLPPLATASPTPSLQTRLELPLKRIRNSNTATAAHFLRTANTHTHTQQQQQQQQKDGERENDPQVAFFSRDLVSVPPTSSTRLRHSLGLTRHPRFYFVHPLLAPVDSLT